jgi:hypothetical protein
MALTAGFGSGKTLTLSQTAAENDVYTIAVTDINAAGFTIDAIIADTVLGVASTTLNFSLNGQDVLQAGTASIAPQSTGITVLSLNATYANLSADAGNLVVTAAGGVGAQSRITLILSQFSDRSITVTL